MPNLRGATPKKVKLSIDVKFDLCFISTARIDLLDETFICCLQYSELLLC